MKIVGMMMVRNEDWVLGLSLRAALEWCDEVLVLDHRSTDRTGEIIDEVKAEAGCRLRRVHVEMMTETWSEMAYREAMLQAARALGATHAAIIDADEVLTGNLLVKVRDWVAGLDPGHVLDLPMVPTWGDMAHYRNDKSVWSRSSISVAIAMTDGMHYATRGPEQYDFHNRTPKGCGSRIRPLAVSRASSAVRADGDNGDDARNDDDLPSGRNGDDARNRKRAGVGFDAGGGGVFHLQFADRERLMWKHTLYKMTEVLRWPDREPVAKVDAKYEQALDETGLIRSPVPTDWWQPYIDRGWINHVKMDATPWQRGECFRLLGEHGRDRFGALNLRGIDERQEATA